MDFKKYEEMSIEELKEQKVKLEGSLKELMLNSSLTSMEKPHLKRVYKKGIAQVNTLLSKGDK